MLKKMRGILIIAFLCFSLPVMAAASEGALNGDFANGMNGWSRPKGAAVENGELHLSGEAAVYIMQHVYNIVPGNTYTLSGRYKAADGGAALKIEWMKPNGENGVTYVGGDYYKSLVASAKWETVSETVKAPAGATMASLLVRKVSQTAGDVYWDDISITGEFGESEGVINSGFSDGLTGWSQPAGAAVEDGALHLSGNAVTVSQRVYNIVPGNTYKLTARHMTPDGGAALQLEWRVKSGPGPDDYGYSGNFYKGVTRTGKWNTVEYIVTAPAHTSAVDIKPRKTSKTEGDVYWDDISLTGLFGEVPQEIVEVESGVSIGLSTDRVFYYSDRQGNGTATLSGTHDATKVEFSLMDGEEKLYGKTVNYGESFSYPLSYLTKEAHPYSVQAVLYKGSNKVSEGERIIYKFPRPKNLGADLVYRQDGKVINPVIMYGMDVPYYSKMSEIGVTVVQDQVNDKTLDAAKAAGVKVLGVLYNGMLPAGHPDKVEYTRFLVEKYKDHEALFGWIVMDEPYYRLVERGLGDKPPFTKYSVEQVDAWLINSYKIIREIDDVHPVFLMENGPDRYKKAAGYADILGIDIYMSGGPSDYYGRIHRGVKSAEEAVEGDKPVYIIMQVSNLYNYQPTATHMRLQVYEAMLGGVEGFGYFKFEEADQDENGKGLTLDKTPLWEGLCDIDIKAEMPFLFALPKGKVAGGVITATHDGKKVQTAIGTGDWLLEAEYTDDTFSELKSIRFLPLTEENRLIVTDASAPIKRFVWTDGQGFLCPPAA